MAIKCSVNLKLAQEAPGVNQWVVGGGAANAVEAVSLTDAGTLFSNTANDRTQWNLVIGAGTQVLDCIPDNATITAVTFRVKISAGTGVARFVCAGFVDTTFEVGGAGGNDFKKYTDRSAFNGGLWTRNNLNGETIGIQFGTSGGSLTINAYWLAIDFTVPEPIFDKGFLLIAGGETLTVELSSGTFFTANYEFHWLNPSTTVGITVVNGHKATTVTPANGGVNPNYSGYIEDPQSDFVGGTRPYYNPAFGLEADRTVASFTINGGTVLAMVFNPTGNPGDDSEYGITGGVTFSGAYSGYLSKDISGIYTLVANQRFDRVYVRAGSTTTQDVQIPNPYAELGYVEADDE